MILAVPLVIIVKSSAIQAFEKVRFSTQDDLELVGWLARPAGPGPFPVVIGLHGCAGLYSHSGKIVARESNWSKQLINVGYAVLLVDSFSPRGIKSVCNSRDQLLKPAGRVRDTFAAIDWLSKQSFASRQSFSLIGWSHGGSTALRVARSAQAHRLQHIIAFYPGCKPLLKRPWRSDTDTTIFQGLLDDWSPAAPCRELARTRGVKFVGFAEAYHDFDHPHLPLRQRKAAYSQRSDGMVTIGTNQQARLKVINMVKEILRVQ